MNPNQESVATMDSHGSTLTAVVTLAKGVVGLFATFGAIVVSGLQEFETWLRVTSLLVGITVGIVTIVSLVRKMPPSRKKHRN